MTPAVRRKLAMAATMVVGAANLLVHAAEVAPGPLHIDSSIPWTHAVLVTTLVLEAVCFFGFLVLRAKKPDALSYAVTIVVIEVLMTWAATICAGGLPTI